MQTHHINAPTRNTNPVPLAATATQWLLLACASCFGSMFAFNTLSPISTLLAIIVAVAVIGLNFAESYLVRFAVASWRFGFTKLALLSAAGVLLISAYSLLAGSSVVESYLMQNQQNALATDYDIAAARQRIQAAKSDALNSFDFHNAQSDFMKTAALENEKIAALLRNKPANNSSVSPAVASTFVAVALEAGIIFLTAFIELFLKPTSLPALVKFQDKLVDWGLDDEQLQSLKISASPSAGTVSLPDSQNRPDVERSGARAVEVLPECVFDEWLKAILSEKIKPTLNSSKKYLRSEHGYKIEYAQEQAGEYLDRAYNLGYLDLNEKTDAFSSQYVLANQNQKLLGQGG